MLTPADGPAEQGRPRWAGPRPAGAAPPLPGALRLKAPGGRGHCGSSRATAQTGWGCSGTPFPMVSPPVLCSGHPRGKADTGELTLIRPGAGDTLAPRWEQGLGGTLAPPHGGCAVTLRATAAAQNLAAPTQAAPEPMDGVGTLVPVQLPALRAPSYGGSGGRVVRAERAPHAGGTAHRGHQHLLPLSTTLFCQRPSRSKWKRQNAEAERTRSIDHDKRRLHRVEGSRAPRRPERPCHPRLPRREAPLPSSTGTPPPALSVRTT